MKLHLSKYGDGTMSYLSTRYYNEKGKEKVAPPEVAQLFKRVTGEDLPNQQGQQTTNEVKETFWKTLNKINEAIRNKQ
jgi:hypothetical protein